MTDHRRFRQLAAAALDFRPTTDEAAELSTHLASCPDCRRYDAGLRADAELARVIHPLHAPDRVRATVLAAAVHPVSRVGTRPVLPVLLAVAVTIVAFVGLNVLGRMRLQGPAHLPSRTWTLLGDGSPFVGAVVWDAIGTGAQVIVTGAVTDGPDPGGAAWISPDGVAWTKIPETGLDGTGELLAANSDTLVLLGHASHNQDASFPPPRAWVVHGQLTCDSCTPALSADVVEPTSTGLPGVSQTTATVFRQITAGGPGFVAVGEDLRYPELMQVAPIGARVATSPDGQTWSVNDPTAAEFAGGSMVDVAGGPAGLVAVGDVGSHATVWRSADGRSWTQVAGAMPGRASVRSIVTGPAGFVAVGDEDGSARAWLSPDGLSWTAAPAAAGLSGARMHLVRWLGTEFVALGEASGVAAAWHSVDGTTWKRYDTGSIFDGASILRVAAIHGRYVLFGQGDPDPNSPQTPAPVVIAVSDAPAQP